MIVCPKCGATLDDSAKFCTVCGTAMASTSQVDLNQPQYYQNQQFNNQNPYYGYPNGTDPNIGYPPPPPYGTPIVKPVDLPTISEIYAKSFALLKAKPIVLWGLSLLSALLCILASCLCCIPIIAIPIVLVLYVGTVSVFLDAYRGTNISAEQLFLGFKSFWHFCGGMAWMLLWIFIWGLIPVAGVVFAIMKAYSYRFVPYILLSNPEISPFDALRESMKQTEGYCGRMFGADILIIGGIVAAYLLVYLLSMIPYMGIIFSIILALLVITVSVFVPLVFGTIQAAFYDEISKKHKLNTETNT